MLLKNPKIFPLTDDFIEDMNSSIGSIAGAALVQLKAVLALPKLLKNLRIFLPDVDHSLLSSSSCFSSYRNR